MYKKFINMIKWKINKKILKTHDYKLNNNNAARIAKKDFNTICKHYTHIKPKNIFSFLKMNREIWNSFKGIGLDISSTALKVAKKAKDNSIYDFVFI